MDRCHMSMPARERRGWAPKPYLRLFIVSGLPSPRCVGLPGEARRRTAQAAALSPGMVGEAQGRSSSSLLWGWPPTMRVITSQR